MLIHLIGSLREFDKDLHTMRKITDVIESSGSSIALRWIEGVHDRKTRGITLESSLDWKDLVEENINSLTHADALIVEGSRFGYSQGFQTMLALQQNKPVLNLYRKDMTEYKEWPDKFFVSGISHPLFTSKAYKGEEDLGKNVTKFLKDHTKKIHELDLKIALDDSIYVKINQLSRETGKTKASIIKDIVSQNLK